jgi:DNA-binding response OmpR family regulator
MSKETTHPPYRIFIVDDDAFLLDMYATKFTQQGFVVTPCSGTLSALEKLRGGETPEIILADLVMPGMDGFAFLEEVQKTKLAPGALVIILSNLGQQEDIDRGFHLGATGYIIKASATPSEVVKRVLEEMEKREKAKEKV